MLIPLRHENMEGRRWPVVTFALIALNILVFLCTHWKMEEQAPERAEVRMHVIILAGIHPELKKTENVQEFVNEIQNKVPEQFWKQLSSPNRKIEDSWDARIRLMEDPELLQAEMDGLAARFTDEEKSSILGNYAFVPAHPRPITYLTSMFLHTGWLHLIGNMWFLWLAGFILEDKWGRVIYPVFYLLAGAAASQFHAWFYPGSIVPALGASGAVAALMGGFLVRFPKMKIHMLWFMLIFRIRFKAYAFWLLPLWLLMEVFYGSLFGQASGVAHWAHVGGFIFGALAALVIGRTGLEHKANAAIEEKISWTADPAIVQGTELMEQGKLDEAITILQKHAAAKPEAMDAYSLLQQLHWRKNDLPSYYQATIKLCQVHLKAQEGEAAWQNYQEYTSAGGDCMPAPTWLELCRIIEGQQNYERAVAEYEHLAEAYPKERQSLLALLSAGRLSLKKLNRPSDALRFYKAAAASSVPHLDWESNIEVRHARSCGGFVESQRVRWAIELLQGEAAGREKREEGLPFFGVSLREVLVLGHRPFVILLSFDDAAQLQPSGRRHAVPTGACILLIILPGRLSLLRLQMELAQLNRGLVVRWQIVLAPVELLQQRIGVHGLRLGCSMLLQDRDGLVELSLFHQFRSLHDGWIGGPTDFFFDGRISLVLQTGASDDQSSESPENKTADVGPMRNARCLAEEAPVEHFHQQPQRK